MEAPEVRYARTRDDVWIAYHVVGDRGPPLLVIPGWQSNLEVMWERWLFGRMASGRSAPSTLRMLPFSTSSGSSVRWPRSGAIYSQHSVWASASNPHPAPEGLSEEACREYH